MTKYNLFIVFLLLIVTAILSYFLYVINDKTEKFSEEVEIVKNESIDFKIKNQRLERLNDSMFVLIDNQNIKIITFQQKIKQLENEDKKFKNFISTIDDSTFYRVLSEITY
jgi:hypothetical protein